MKKFSYLKTLFLRFILIIFHLVLIACGGGSGEDGGSSGVEPAGITSDGTHLYITDSNRTIRKVRIETREVTTLAGSASSTGSTDGEEVVARFNRPVGITTDGSHLYVLDKGNNTIRKINEVSVHEVKNLDTLELG